MSNVGLPMQESSSGRGGSPKSPKPPRKRPGIAVGFALLLVVAIVGGIGFGGYLIYKQMKSGGPTDYAGPGSGVVVVEITQGQTLSDIASSLREADVIASTEVFIETATLEPRATSVKPGNYSMLKQMSAQGALERLLDPAALTDNVVTIPEGLRTGQTVAKLSAATRIAESEFMKVIQSPTQLPLPSWAKGSGAARAEGFLFPSTYQFPKKATAKEILNDMVARFNEVTRKIDFVARSKATGRTPYEVLNIASIAQAEGRPADFSKITRVIYNRLNPKTWGGTYGYLGVDATLNYALNQFKTNLTKSELATNSPYNTSTEHHQGLPPTPIDSPGEQAMEAALNPASGNWLYYVTVNLDTGETKFTNNYDEFLKYQQELREYEARKSK